MYSAEWEMAEIQGGKVPRPGSGPALQRSSAESLAPPLLDGPAARADRSAPGFSTWQASQLDLMTEGFFWLRHPVIPGKRGIKERKHRGKEEGTWKSNGEKEEKWVTKEKQRNQKTEAVKNKSCYRKAF